MVQRLHLALDPTADVPPQDVTGYAEGAPFVTAEGKIFVLKDGAWVPGAGGGGAGGVQTLDGPAFIGPDIPADFDMNTFNTSAPALSGGAFKFYVDGAEVEPSAPAGLNGDRWYIYGQPNDLQPYSPFYDTSVTPLRARFDARFVIPAGAGKVPVTLARGTGDSEYFFPGSNPELRQNRVYVDGVEVESLRVTGRSGGAGYVLGTGPTAQEFITGSPSVFVTVMVDEGEHYLGIEEAATAPDSSVLFGLYLRLGKWKANLSGFPAGTLVEVDGKVSVLTNVGTKPLVSFDFPNWNNDGDLNDPISYSVAIGQGTGRDEFDYPWITGADAFLRHWSSAQLPLPTYETDYPTGKFYAAEYSVFVGPVVVVGVEAYEAVAIGDYASAIPNGRDPFNNEGYQVAIGAYAAATPEAVAMGDGAEAFGDYSLAIGSGASTSNYADCAVGVFTETETVYDDPANATQTTPTIDAQNSVFGAFASTDRQVSESVALGSNAYCRGPQVPAGTGEAARYRYDVALGYNALTNGNDSMALGANASARHQSVAIGSGATAVPGGLTFGDVDPLTQIGCTALGYNALAYGVSSTALGQEAEVNTGFDRSTALGYYATATKADQVMLGGTDGTSVAPVVTVFSGLLELPVAAVQPDATAGTPTLYVGPDGSLRFKKADGTLQTVTVT